MVDDGTVLLHRTRVHFVSSTVRSSNNNTKYCTLLILSVLKQYMHCQRQAAVLVIKLIR